MKVVKHGFYSVVKLTPEEAKTICKIGQGSETCIWCCVSGDGFECLYYNKPSTLQERLRRGDTVGKRDGCEEIKNIF